MHVDGPLLVLAGAGSGKTRVTTRRAAYLATHATRPQNVLAITFTNKAASEMRERIEALGVGGPMTVCTFHSLCARLLRQYHEAAGVARDFTIFDESDRRKVVRRAISECELSESTWPVVRLGAQISRAKNDMRSPQRMAETARDSVDRTVARVYEHYERLLTEQQAMDFDDLLYKMAMLLHANDDLRERLEDRFRYVLVDEYQDTNGAQYVIARKLTLRDKNLCATGDPDQSIYGWRGANIHSILEFEKDFPETKVVRLEQNYRSSKRILAAASTLITCNQRRKEKALWTENAEGPPVRVVACQDGQSEADWVAQAIIGEHAAGRAYRDVAIFYRVNAMTRLLEDSLRQHQIPYQIARGVEFYNRKEIKDVLAYLRVLVNPADEVSLLRVINVPARGIGKTTLDRLVAEARRRQTPLIDVLRRADEVPSISRAAAKVQAFVSLLDAMAPQEDEPVGDIVERAFVKSGLRDELVRAGETAEDALENVNELISAASEYDEREPEGTLADWLQQISLVSDADAVDEDAGAVTLMTLHTAKGLEFPVVFVIGLEEGLLPHERSQRDDAELEEERRLCFVGMTRAEERLTLTHAAYRTMRGMSMRTVRSPFLYEIGGGIDTVDTCTVAAFLEPDDSPRMESPTDVTYGDYDFADGDLVRHPKFGVGRLLWIEPMPGKTRAGIKFARVGEKTLNLEFAKLERVEMEA